MTTDTIINVKDTVSRIELILPSDPEPTILGLPQDLASILIPVVVTIIIFGLGLFFQWRSKQKDKLNRLSSFKTLIIEWSRLSEKTITTQCSLYSKLVDDIKKEKSMQPVSFYHEPFLIDKLDDLDLEKLIELIIINSKGDKKTNSSLLFKIVKWVHKLSNIEKNVIDKYEDYMNYAWKLSEQWNSNFRTIQDFGTSIINKIENTENIEKQFYKDAFVFMDALSKIKPEDNNTQTILEVCIIPLHELCSKYIRSNNAFEYVFKLKSSVFELTLLWHQWSGYKNGIERHFLLIEKDTTETLKDLKESIAIFDNMTLNNWMKIK